jgi:hypothetical protein
MKLHLLQIYTRFQSTSSRIKYGTSSKVRSFWIHNQTTMDKRLAVLSEATCIPPHLVSPTRGERRRKGAVISNVVQIS